MSSILQEYGFRVMSGRCQVVHKRTGCTTPYNHGKTYIRENDPAHYKEEVFKEWFALSRKMRKSYYMAALNNNLIEGLNQLKPSEAIQFLSLESCKTAAPTGFNAPVCTATTVRCQIEAYDRCKQEGTTPMCYNTPETEAEISRAYLSGRLGDANYAKRDQLRKLFNLDSIAIPKTYKELVDAIKNGKYEIDAKIAKRIEFSVEDEGQYYGSPLDGITFTDFPKPDYEGFNAASVEQKKKYTQTKDAFFLPYEQGLKALADFEAWMPEAK